MVVDNDHYLSIPIGIGFYQPAIRMKMLKAERRRDDVDDLIIWVSRVNHTA